MSRIAIIAALPGELKPLVQGWSNRSKDKVSLWHHCKGADEWIAACAGIGVEAANHAWNEIAQRGAIDALFSIGWAGALRDECAAGRAYGVAGVIDAQTGERIRAVNTAGETWLVTAPRIADRAEKARLAAAYGASLVDMEAFGVARTALTQGIPFYCIKGVSDGPRDLLPDFNRFVSAEHRLKLSRLILFSFIRPWLWSSLMRLGVNSNHAARGIRRLVLATLEKPPFVFRSGSHSRFTS